MSIFILNKSTTNGLTRKILKQLKDTKLDPATKRTLETVPPIKNILSIGPTPVSFVLFLKRMKVLNSMVIKLLLIALCFSLLSISVTMRQKIVMEIRLRAKLVIH